MDTKQEIVRREASGNEMATLFPPVDVIEDNNGITLTADLPGVTKENLAIRVDADMLTIEGVVILGEPQSLEAVYAEVRADQYKRTFTLSRELDVAQIAASIKDGVLTLHVPKLEQAKPRRIEVKVD
ncbi:MAG: Hsp20/alpha crystallin family protein [Collimonas pratensis]|uniref:Hsp20/alpha crystallin family protein n=1 Tax=Collimonas pratensis TaxID=279113 RepID=UPI003C715F93